MKITVALLRDLEKQVMNGTISYSRMVELINEEASKQGEPKNEQLTCPHTYYTQSGYCKYCGLYNAEKNML